MISEFVSDYRKLLKQRMVHAMESVISADSWDDFVARRARVKALREAMQQFDDFVKDYNNR